MAKLSKKFFILSFSLTFIVGLIFLFANFSFSEVLAANVNVNAMVPSIVPCGNGVIDPGEECESASDCTGEGVTCVSCHCQGGVCFLAGTEISLAEDKKLPIEKIKVGDFVISYNELTKELEPAIVLRTFEHRTNQYLLINGEFGVTANHPLYINGQWQAAGKIKIGDRLLRQDGQDTIVSSVEIKTGDFLVYNLEVEKNHNYFAQSYLAHNKGECIPNCVGRQCGASNCPGISCGSCPVGKTCSGGLCLSQPSCGDGLINQPTEECEPPNSSGCSADCKIVFTITSHSVPQATITNNSALVNWVTNLNSTSILEWRKSGGVWENSREGLSGTNYSELITNLQVGTVYDYRITAVRSGFPSQQDQKTGSFQTTGGPAENCTNGLDDDNDGLIDYLDPDCYCEAVYQCTAWQPAECPQTKIQTRECEWTNSDICWNPQPMEPTSKTCTPECQISCTSCQRPNLDQCICEDIIPCCGNGSCEPWAEPPEDYLSCPQDCPLSCLPDWQCTEWGICTNGIQTRECFDQHACGNNFGRPDEIMGCTPNCTISCPGVCHELNLDQCVCEALIPCCGNLVCETGEDHQICPADCIEICLPNWAPGSWSECVHGIQKRTYQDLNNCPQPLLPPPDERSCLPGCNVACGLCQNINVGTCSCLPIYPCCGDRICQTDQGENVVTCPIDCGLPPTFTLTLPQCLDGLDNDSDGFIDYPADLGCATAYDNDERSLAEILNNILKILNNPQVQQANKITASILIALVVINSFATFSFFNFLSYLQYFFSQPLAALFRRRRRKWGVVYNSLSKQPIDLAIVRLYQKENGRLVQSRVTDKIGRYSFLVDLGRYYLVVTKPGFDFPTFYLKDTKQDVKFLDLYHGETIEVSEKDSAIALNIPIDPREKFKPVFKIIFQHYLRKIQYLTAFAAIPLAVISMMISPGPLTFTLLGFHCLLFALFYRLGYQKPPKNWGKIFDATNRRPINRAITRIYDKKYNKLLETRLTDAFGRYAFLVNNNIYYLTAEKIGYKPHKSQDIDLVSKDREAIVNLDLGLEKLKDGEKPGEIQTPPEVAKEIITPIVPPPPSQPKAPSQKPELSLEQKVESLGVGRESLTGLLQSKEKIEDIKQDIDQRQEKLETLEEKIDDIKESIDQKLEQLNQKSDSVQKPISQNQVETTPQQPVSPKPETVKSDQQKSEEKKPEADNKDKPRVLPPPEKSIFG